MTEIKGKKSDFRIRVSPKIIPSIEKIKLAVEGYYNVKISYKTRSRAIVKPRQVAHFISHVVFGYSLDATGKVIGGLDHATVLHSCKTVMDEMDIYRKIKSDVEYIIKSILSEAAKTPESPESMLKKLTRSRTINIHTKIELKEILQRMEAENEGEDWRF